MRRPCVDASPAELKKAVVVDLASAKIESLLHGLIAEFPASAYELIRTIVDEVAAATGGGILCRAGFTNISDLFPSVFSS